MVSPSTLDILGVGVDLPPARPIKELVREVGGDPTLHDGWRNACVARPADHPSTLATRALGAALDEAKLRAAELDLVLSVGVSRDYLPSWSIANAVMHELGASPECFGFDLTIGCLGSLTGLHVALDWLRGRGGGYAAIVCGERWSHTIDRRSTTCRAIWSHADAGGAIVVGLHRDGTALAAFHGAVFANHYEFNGIVNLKYGGTRFPQVPPGEDPQRRTVAPIPPHTIWSTYAAEYKRVAGLLHARFGVTPQRLICNQISPNVVAMIGEAFGVPQEYVCKTGNDVGHIGSADIILGLRRLIDQRVIDGPIAVAASVPYAFGAGLFTPR